VPEETVQEEPVKPASSLSIGKILMIAVLALASSAGGGVVSFMLINRGAFVTMQRLKHRPKTKKKKWPKFSRRAPFFRSSLSS
jgi:hypothetical protein